MNLRFSSDQIILVTGASSGLGRALALRLCKDGATILANGRDIARLESVKADSANPERVIVASRDLEAEMDAIPGWIMELSKKYGRLAGLACCAGADNLNPLAMINVENATKLFRINWLAPILLARGFADRRVNCGSGSAMLFIASIAAELPLKGQIAYASSKAALIAAMKDIAQETGSRGIRANSISPGFVSTPMNQSGVAMQVDMDKSEKARQVLGPGTPEDIASLGSFLLSDEARWITGQNYTIDGGRF